MSIEPALTSQTRVIIHPTGRRDGPARPRPAAPSRLPTPRPRDPVTSQSCACVAVRLPHQCVLRPARLRGSGARRRTLRGLVLGCTVPVRPPVAERCAASVTPRRSLRVCSARFHEGELELRAAARRPRRCVPRLAASPLGFSARLAVLDSSAQTLFLTEMFRGMSLTLRYFFDTKVTVPPHSLHRLSVFLDCCASCRSIIRLRRDSSARASAASTCCGATRRGRSAASRASYVRQSAPHKPSPSRLRSGRMAAAAPPAMTLT